MTTALSTSTNYTKFNRCKSTRAFLISFGGSGMLVVEFMNQDLQLHDKTNDDTASRHGPDATYC
jgi:hypothetical protein